MKALQMLREFLGTVALQAFGLASMGLSVPGAIMRNPLLYGPTAALVLLKLFGVIAWSWWAVTAPAWGGLAFYGAYILARQERAQRERRRAEQAAAEGRSLGVFRRGPDGRPEASAVYAGTADACLRYVREHAASVDAARRLFVVRALDSAGG